MGVFIIYEWGGTGKWEGGKWSLLPYIGGQKGFTLGKGGGGGKKSLMVCILLCSGF